jgi:aldose 1-epimerase
MSANFGLGTLAVAAVLAPLALAAGPQSATATRAGVTRTDPKILLNNQAVEVFTLTNAAGVEIKAINYGGIITSWRVPERNGQLADIVLGYDDPTMYS